VGLTLPATGLFLHGEWTSGEASERDDVVDPTTEAVLTSVVRATAGDARRAVAAARAAFDDGPWRRFDGAERGRHLRRLQQTLSARAEQLTALIVAEVGTPLAGARSHQVGLPIEHLEHWAERATRPEVVEEVTRPVRRSDGTTWTGHWTVRREPAGVVAAISAYNFPLLLTLMKVGPALAAGNTVVVKPSPFTPLTVLALAEAAAEADLPPGVLNVVTGGADAGEVLTTDPRVDVVSFTGSDATGARIMAQAAATLKRVVLELGGKSALVVRHDADLDLAVEQGVRGFTFNAGQGCALTTRHLVHRSLLAPYLERIGSAVSRMRIGDPADPATHLGPLIRREAVDRTDRYVQEAVESGATIVTGGRRPKEQPVGFFYEPTLLTDVDNRWPVAQDEIFGPVAVVIPFDADDEAVALANDSRYGLDGAIVSADEDAAMQMAERLRTGGVSINGGAGWTSPAVPFGGYKRSGVGRENGDAGLDEYTELKTIKRHLP
jgi:aldehyde dehydrogenase (NAD+)